MLGMRPAMADQAQRPSDPVSKSTHGSAVPSIERLLSYEQAGTLLGVTGRTVWAMVHRGDLLAVRFGHSVRIDPADLRSFIDRSKCGRVPHTAQKSDGR